MYGHMKFIMNDESLWWIIWPAMNDELGRCNEQSNPFGEAEKVCQTIFKGMSHAAWQFEAISTLESKLDFEIESHRRNFIRGISQREFTEFGLKSMVTSISRLVGRGWGELRDRLRSFDSEVPIQNFCFQNFWTTWWTINWGGLRLRR